MRCGFILYLRTDLCPVNSAIAEKIKGPILTTFRAKGILPEDNPRVI